MFDNEDEEDYFDGNLNEDLELFENYLNGGSMSFLDSDRVEILIDHYLINSQYSKANQAADYAIYQFPYNAVYRIRKAQAMSAMGQLKEALSILTIIEKTETNSCELLLTKASIFSQLRDHKSALRYFNDALLLCEEEDRDEIYLDLAMEYEALKDFKNALKVLQQAIKSNPENEGAIYEIAFCYDQIGDYEKAIKCYSDFIDENPYSFTAWYNLGNAYSKMENFEKAIWAYEYCVVINEDFGPVYFNLGNAFMGLDKFNEAIEAFDTCQQLDGDDAMAMCYIGECHEQLNELELAKKYYNKSLELAPILPDAWLGLGIVEDLKGNTKEGITLIRKALDLDPDNAGIYHVLAGAYEKLEDFETANELYTTSLGLDATDQDCLQSFVAMLMTQWNLTQVLSFVQNFEENYGKNELRKLLEVNVLWSLGEKEMALNLFKQCVEEDKELAKEIFEVNPDLLNVSDFVHLTED